MAVRALLTQPTCMQGHALHPWHSQSLYPLSILYPCSSTRTQPHKADMAHTSVPHAPASSQVDGRGSGVEAAPAETSALAAVPAPRASPNALGDPPAPEVRARGRCVAMLRLRGGAPHNGVAWLDGEGWLALPTDMLVVIVQHVRPATSVLSMYEICNTWRTRLLEAAEKDVEAIWCTLAAERFPMAAQILKHVQVSGRQLYRSQLKHQTAVYDEIAPPPPCRTTLRQYLFTVELNFYHHNGTSLHRAEWSGFLTDMEDEEREKAMANDEYYRVSREGEHAWVLWDAKPDWLPSGELQKSVRHSARISVTNLATVTTILLFDDVFFMDASNERTVLPNACGKRLSKNWNRGDNGMPRSPEYCDVAALSLNYEDTDVDSSIPQGIGIFHFGCVRCEVTSGYDADGRVQVADGDPGIEYFDHLRSDELLCYLEHFAPWHLG